MLDQVGIDYVAPTGVTDPGFEGLSLGTGLSANKYDPTGSAWSFSGTAGVASNGSGFTYGNANALQGTQVGFLQDTGSFSQVVSLSATGFYLISFSAAQTGQAQALEPELRGSGGRHGGGHLHPRGHQLR